MVQVLIVVVVVAAAFALQLFVQQGITNKYDYQCGKCGATFSMSPVQASIAPHRLGGSKYTKCPSCGARSWVSPVPRQQAP